MATKTKKNNCDDLEKKIIEQEEEIHRLHNSVDYWIEEADQLRGRYDELQPEKETGTVNTMIGELKYSTNNLVDEQIMDVVTQLMVKVRPVKLIEILQNTLKGHDLL